MLARAACPYAGLSPLGRLPVLILICWNAFAAESPVFPGADWDQATPESQGVDARLLQRAVKHLEGVVGKDGVREVVIVRHGRMIWHGNDIDKRHGVWSATKSFTSTVLGLLIADGKCTLDTRVADILPELEARYPQVTLRHFTTMTSGYRAVGDETTGSYKHGPSSTPFIPNPQPLFTPPGTQYAYWDSAMNLFALALTRLAGESIEVLFERRVAGPIGLKDWDWGDYATVDGVVVNGGSGNGNKHVFITAREMARFGLLFLNQGKWNGRQRVPEAWVAQATRLQVPAAVPWAQPESGIDGRGCYGFNWWVNGIKPDGTRKLPAAPADTFWASGFNNNKCFVLPAWDMVVVRLGLDGNVDDAAWNGFFARLAKALEADQSTAGGSTTDGLELPSAPVFGVTGIAFTGPLQTATDNPARDVDLAVTFEHEGADAAYTVQGFFDGDGQVGIEGDVFKVRFCPTLPGRWTLSRVESNSALLAGQHEGHWFQALPSALHGFWIPDDASPGRRWYRRSDGSHQYIVGNTHYSFLSETGPDGRPTGGNVAADIAGNARFFKKLRFGIQSDRYPHPTGKPWLDAAGHPTDDGNWSHRPNPRWFHQRVDLAVRTAFEHDLIADLILAGPDTEASRSTLKARDNGGDATPLLRYLAARYGAFPNVWFCLCNEYDIKRPSYTQSEIAGLGSTLRKHLSWPTPLSVHDGSRIGWSADFDTLTAWADHQIIQKKLRAIAPAAAAIQAVTVENTNPARHRGPTINDELSYEGAGDRHTREDTVSAHLGAFVGGGYATTGEKHGNKLGQYFWGRFDAATHTAAEPLAFLRQVIDREITFWKLTPDSAEAVFPELDVRFRAMGWAGQEYVLGTDTERNGLVALLAPGRWQVTRHDLLARESTVIAGEAAGRFEFNAPASRAVLWHFKRLQPDASPASPAKPRNRS